MFLPEITHIIKQWPASIQALPYLDMVVYETLRFWPLGDLERKCVKDYRNRISSASRFELDLHFYLDMYQLVLRQF